ncbi:MAG: tetratricopeptide repeat protein [Thermoguttaceae bacterium]|jgi:tetratricopeptide (TPR) repeat protein
MDIASGRRWAGGAALAGVLGGWIWVAAAAGGAENAPAGPAVPGRAEACCIWGNALSRLGWYHGAAPFYRAALRLRPDFAKAHVGLADALARPSGCRAFEEGVAHCRKVLETEPDNERAHYVLGRLLSSLGRMDEALTHLKEAVELKPDHAEARAKLGSVLDECGRFDEAVAQCRKAVRIKPRSAEVRIYLAEALRRRGQWDEAIAECRKVLETSPGNTNAHMSLASAFLGRGRFDEAVAHLRKALEINPSDPKLHNNLAVLFWEQADLETKLNHGKNASKLREEARDHWRTAAKLAPYDPYTQANLGHVLFEARQSERDLDRRAELIAEATEHVRLSIQNRPILPEPHNTYGRIHWAVADRLEREGRALEGQGKREDARAKQEEASRELDGAAAEFREALKYDPGLLPARENLAKLLMALNKWDEAQEEVDVMLSQNPSYVGGWLCQARISSEKKRPDRALAAYSKAARLDPNNMAVQDAAAMAYWQQGKRAEAAPHLRALLRLSPEPAVLAERFGAIYHEQKNMDEAARAWTFMAFALATSPVDSVRNGAKAVELARRAVELPGGRTAAGLDALAAAHAERGQFPDALRAAREAAGLAGATGNAALAAALRARIVLYEKGRPFRDTWDEPANK